VAYSYTAGTQRVNVVAGNRRQVFANITLDGATGNLDIGMGRIESAGVQGITTGDSQVILNVNSSTTTQDNDGNPGIIDVAGATASAQLFHALGV
jgi:hypothetical protein